MAAPAVQDELEGARIIDFPLRGEWMAVQTPASRIPSHGTDMLGQRYAFDLIRFDPQKGGQYHPAGGLRTLLFGVPTRECHGWGEPIHAPLDGEVVAARDGIPERGRIHPVRELALVLKNGLTFRPTPHHLHRLLGNHVILRCGDVYAGFAHLTTGSVAVEVGQLVQVGDVLGRVGHTGNSTAPHLHFQLMDGPDPLTARGIPCAFREYEVWRDGDWRRVEGAIPNSTERIRSVGG
ncbi:MAG TPA: peptidoglycan DD-metalloendopeptidase family protein [Patescibacteria group bacterium]|nr:peptidoglycan DD-metalloendopeptidase family protein [Patescibacteria group bacterium]